MNCKNQYGFIYNINEQTGHRNKLLDIYRHQMLIRYATIYFVSKINHLTQVFLMS